MRVSIASEAGGEAFPGLVPRREVDHLDQIGSTRIRFFRDALFGNLFPSVTDRSVDHA